MNAPDDEGKVGWDPEWVVEGDLRQVACARVPSKASDFTSDNHDTRDIAVPKCIPTSISDQVAKLMGVERDAWGDGAYLQAPGS